MADEMVRVTRPGGLIFLSYTLWWGPWGGHETSPWHYLGGGRAARRYERRLGHRPKNVYGDITLRGHRCRGSSLGAAAAPPPRWLLWCLATYRAGRGGSCASSAFERW